MLVDAVVGAGAGMIAPVATATDVMGANVVGLTLFVVGLMTTVVFLSEPAPVWILVVGLGLETEWVALALFVMKPELGFGGTRMEVLGT